MVQPQSVERFDTVIAVMTETEARTCVAAINGHMNSARALLLDLYERRGWAALGYSSWRECAVAEFEDSQRHLYRQLEAAQIERRIDQIGQIGTIPESHLRPLTALTPMEQPIAWQEATERTNGKPTARDVAQVVDEMLHPDEWQPPMEEAQTTDLRKMRTNTGMFTSATPEWYTPAHIIDRVIKLFGEIDLDPCSNAKGEDANVEALNHWTQEDDGLSKPWAGKVYMNPPYGDEIGPWVARLDQAYKAEEIHEAIALLPGRTDTDWFVPMFAYPICFVHGRLKFSGSDNSATFPSVIVYLGIDLESFKEFFIDIGPIMIPA